MANSIKLNVSSNKRNVPIRTNNPNNTPDIAPIDKDPFYVGAKAYVEQIENGYVATFIDKDGTTTATLYNGEKGEKGDKGDKGDTGSLPLYSDTTANWNAQPSLIAEAGAMYIYTDHAIVDGEDVAGVKFGDGTTYLIDLPFTDAEFRKHVENTDIHITAEEREFWNNKERSIVTGETLILTNL